MRCIASWVRQPEHEHGGLPAQRVRDRRAAASCLQAAAKTADAFERSSLRRRAAELILPRKRAAVEALGA